MTDPSLLGSFAWIEAPALLLIGVLWFITGDWRLASEIVVVAFVPILPASMILVPLRVVPHQDSQLKHTDNVFGPVAYVFFLVGAFSVFMWVLYVLILLGR